jgi:hypothetical protein
LECNKTYFFLKLYRGPWNFVLRPSRKLENAIKSLASVLLQIKALAPAYGNTTGDRPLEGNMPERQ